MEINHIETPECGFDRNASHAAGRYVCACGWSDAPFHCGGKDHTYFEEQLGAAPEQPAAQDGHFSTQAIEDEKLIAAQRREIAELKRQLAEASELHAMQIAAICTAAMSNSRNSEPPIGKDNPYWSLAYQDTVDAVLREMTHRERAESEVARVTGLHKGLMQAVEAERDALKADAERWREVEQHFTHERCGPNVGWTIGNLVLQGDSPTDAIDAAIAARRGE